MLFPVAVETLKRLEQKPHLTVVLPLLDWAQTWSKRVNYLVDFDLGARFQRCYLFVNRMAIKCQKLKRGIVTRVFSQVKYLPGNPQSIICKSLMCKVTWRWQIGSLNTSAPHDKKIYVRYSVPMVLKSFCERKSMQNVVNKYLPFTWHTGRDVLAVCHVKMQQVLSDPGVLLVMIIPACTHDA